MRSVIILVIACMIMQAAFSQVTPFTGGAGSGFKGNVSASISCPMFFGGEADGIAVGKTPAIVCAMFFGGVGDGFDAGQSNCEELLTEAAMGERSVAASTKGAAIVAGSMKVFPNPTNGMATLSMVAATPMRTQVILYRADGQVVRSIPVQLIKGVNIFPLDLQGLAAGLYIVYNSAQRERVKVLVKSSVEE